MLIKFNRSSELRSSLREEKVQCCARRDWAKYRLATLKFVERWPFFHTQVFTKPRASLAYTRMFKMMHGASRVNIGMWLHQPWMPKFFEINC